MPAAGRALRALGAFCFAAMIALSPTAALPEDSDASRALLDRLRVRALVELARLQDLLAVEEKRLAAAEAALQRRFDNNEPSGPLAAAMIEDLERDIRAMSMAMDVDVARAEAERRIAELIRAEDAVRACGPLRREDIPELPRRVLSLPGARLHEFVGAGPHPEALPAFSVLHVFQEAEVGEGARWLEVGKGPACADRAGWIAAAQSEDWKTMLVMTFAPRGVRERTLFFRDADDLAARIEGGFAAADAWQALDALAAGVVDNEMLVAVEPKTATAFADNPFLMPILDWRYAEFADGSPTTLVEVAGVSADADVRRDDTVDDGAVGPLPAADDALKELRVGVKFVIDTTISMQPYIDRTNAAIGIIYDRLKDRGLLDRAAFGLVAYRDNLAPDPRIEYVTEVVQRLDAGVAPATVLARLAAVRRSPVPTQDWDEDAYAALETAILDDDWEGFDARFLVLITDAGARDAFDPLAARAELGAEEIAAMANDRRIAIVPIHLLTPEGKRARNHESARSQFLTLSRTGDANDPKYVGVPAGEPEAFRAGITALANRLADGVAALAEGRLERPAAKPIAQDAPKPSPLKSSVEARLEDIVTNELFRAQLEFLGRRRDRQAQGFFRAWASDRDLTDPQRGALDVKVFLTRNELSALAQGLGRIIEAAEANQTDPKRFFDQLTGLSAAVAVQGRAVQARADQADALGDLLPAFLRALPYRSRILKLTRDDWLSLGPTGRDQLINTLKSKLATYRDMNGNERIWSNFNPTPAGADAPDPAAAVTPTALKQLP